VRERLKELLWRLDLKIDGEIAIMSEEPLTEESFGFSRHGMTPKRIYGKHDVTLRGSGTMMAIIGGGDRMMVFISPDVVGPLKLKKGDRIKVGFFTRRVEVLEEA